VSERRSNRQGVRRGSPATAAANGKHQNRCGGAPRPPKRSCRGVNSTAHCPAWRWAVTSGNGVLVNCTQRRPSGCRATRRSPARAGWVGRASHTAWPCWICQPGAERSSAGRRGSERQAPAKPRQTTTRPSSAAGVSLGSERVVFRRGRLERNCLRPARPARPVRWFGLSSRLNVGAQLDTTAAWAHNGSRPAARRRR